MQMQPLPGMLKILSADCSRYPLPDLFTWLENPRILDMVYDAELLIIDNLSSLCRAGVENDAESWVPLQEFTHHLRRLGIAVLLIHHSGKNGSQRGTSRREDALDVVINLVRPIPYKPQQGARIEVRFEKARGLAGRDLAPIGAALIEGEDGSLSWNLELTAGALNEEVVRLREMGLKQREIAKLTGISLGKVSGLLNPDRHVRRDGRVHRSPPSRGER